MVRNLLYRLTPFDSYRQGLVKKIEVLSVAERNDEATLKIEVEEVRTFTNGKEPEVKLTAWRFSATKNACEFRSTPFLKVGDDLEAKTGNVSYRGYVIKRIYKSLRDRHFKVQFANGVELVEKEQSRDFSGIFGEQLYWLIDTHFRKRAKLREKGIKCLSLVFIDRVDNYVRADGLIRNLFVEKYRLLHKEHCGTEPTAEEIEAVQGYYFAQTGKGEYTDNERSMVSNKELFDLILKEKEKLLSPDNPVEFIFSHSALGVGWDNPNVFNIATLNHSYSEIKKRQEIGRGLRICVNRHGERVYDPADVAEGEEVNLLTVIPNETYETFVTQYQSEIVEIYGTPDAGAGTRHRHKDKDVSKRTLRRNDQLFNSDSFREFWRRLSRKTDYLVVFDEETVIARAVEALNAITIGDYEAEITLNRITDISATEIRREHLGSETARLTARFAPLDLVEELSESTALAYPTVFRIVSRLDNLAAIVKNPPLFLQKATAAIRRIELEEMLRALQYRPTGEAFPIDEFSPELISHSERIQPTPQRGLYDAIVWDSDIEKAFAVTADKDPEVVCLLKLPAFYKIPTPIGDYNPDFGLVLKRKRIREEQEEDFYFVIETKGTNDLEDKKALTASEVYKIKCAIKHFAALGIEARVDYKAPVKDYATFKSQVKDTAHA
jgi:type III restriction enzyme